MYLGVVPGFSENPVLVATSDGSNFATLPVPMKTEEFIAFINGAIQRRYVDYWSSGDAVVFSENVPEGAQILVYGIHRRDSIARFSTKSAIADSMAGGIYAVKADVVAGVAGNKLVTPLAIADVGLTKQMHLTDLSIDVGPQGEFVNELGEQPKLVTVTYRCVANDLGYSVGDIFLEGTYQYSYDASRPYGTGFIITNDVIKVIGGQSIRMYVPRKDTNVNAVMTLGSWVIDAGFYS